MQKKQSPSARYNHLLQLVRETGFSKISELSEQLGVSEMTVRRDIRVLAEKELLEAVHGGARILMPQIGDNDFRLRADRNRAVKQTVAQQIHKFLKPGMVVALDAGSTILEIARILPTDMQLTVITHSMPVMTVLSQREGIILHGLGGLLRQDTQSFTGPITIRTVNEFKVDILFLATMSINDGIIYSINPFDAEMKQILISISEKVILVTDSSKFQAKAGIRVTNLDDIDAIIVDDRRDVSNLINEEKTKLIIAPLDKSSVPEPGD